MTMDVGAALGDAWAMWRRDRDLLIRVAGPFLFLPALALALLVPPAGVAAPPGATVVEQLQAMSDFIAAHAAYYVAAMLVTKFGEATLLALYLDPARPDVRGAMRRGLLILPRYVLASVLVTLATMAGFLLVIVPGLIVLARTMLTGPVLFAEAPTAALQAPVRSARLTRGQTLPLVALTMVALAARFVLVQPFAALDEALRSARADNPVAIAIIDVAGAIADAGIDLAVILVAIGVYRRLSSRGT